MTQRRVRRVALTGGIATGKSYVRRRLEAAGVPTIDSDVLAREAVHAGSPGLAALVQRFGPEMLTPDGALDRRAMARLVFDDETARRDLEAIVHPVVRSATDAWYERLAAQGEATLAVADVPLLYETGRDPTSTRSSSPPVRRVSQIARVWRATASPTPRRARASRRSGRCRRRCGAPTTSSTRAARSPTPIARWTGCCRRFARSESRRATSVGDASRRARIKLMGSL